MYVNLVLPIVTYVLEVLPAPFVCKAIILINMLTVAMPVQPTV